VRVIELTGSGGPEVLRLSERPDPSLGHGEVQVRVHHSGVNRADLLQRQGRYPTPGGFPPDVPGIEYSGVVERLGEGCYLRREGERVMGVLGGGGYAERVSVPERETILVPKDMSLETAAGVPEAFMTAWDALFNLASLRAGEVVLIHAVGSGVGTAGLQLVRTTGARSIGTSRTQAKLDRAGEMGLDEGILANDGEGWATGVLESTGERGVDVILDLVGAAYLEGNLEVLAPKARWIVVGVPSGRTGMIDLRRLMGRRASVTGTVLRARPSEEKAALARDFERTLVPLFESGRLSAVLDRAFPAEDASEAHRYIEENRSFGTIVLSWPTED
jgi:NADPH2:quinone reductase